MVFPAGGERRAVFWCLPPSRPPEAPSRAEGGSSGDDSHCPRRTQAVVKGTLWVVRLITGPFVLCDAIRTFAPISFLGVRLPCPPGIEPVPPPPIRRCRP